MRFPAAGKNVVRPSLAFCCWFRGCARHHSAAFRAAIPILGRIGNPPNIPRIVKRNSNKKAFPILSERLAIGNARGSASTSRQFAEQHRRFQRQLLRRAQSATLRADHQRDAFCGKRIPAIHAGHGDRNLDAQPRAAPCRFLCKHIHLRVEIGWNLICN